MRDIEEMSGDMKKVLDGLRHCSDTDPQACEGCPYRWDERCTGTVMYEALLLIGVLWTTGGRSEN